MIPDYLYKWVYLILCTIIVIAHNQKLTSFKGSMAVSRFGHSTNGLAVVLLVFVILFIGTRPLSVLFTDMHYYAGFYQALASSTSIEVDIFEGDFLWLIFQKICYYVFGMSSSVWLLTVTLVSMMFRYSACRNLFKENTLSALLFIITSFSFWGAVTNIIRSDMAFGVAIYGISLVIKEKNRKNYLVALLFFLIAIFVHKSSLLLILSFLASFFVVKDIRWAIGFWVLCVFMSIVNHSFFEHLFLSLGFDDRVERYISGEAEIGVFSHTGFRWDFLLYSIIPIVIGWFVTKKSNDGIYSIILNTYILANGFWVLVIRALFSDRFAGISWSIYGLVLAYPLLKINIWKNQPRIAALGLTGQVSFLWLMHIYYLHR